MERCRKWVSIGSGIGIGSLLFAGAVLGASRYLVGLAMDREGPKAVDRYLAKVTDSPAKAAWMEKATAAKKRLESAGCDTVQTQSHDGLRLVGHWRPCREPKRVIVAMHGWRSSWSKDFGMIADFWHRNRCSVLYAEQRGQGSSEGGYMGFGMLERQDCVAWARWVIGQCGETVPVYLAGLSMGATTVLMAGGMELPSSVRGIMADCGFTSAYEIWKHVAKNGLHLRYGLYAAAANDLCKRKIHMGPREYSTLDAMVECEVPVLLIHGTEDRFVPVEMTYENYKACRGDKWLLIVPGADHAMSYCVERERYEQAVRDFWNSCDH